MCRNYAKRLVDNQTRCIDLEIIYRHLPTKKSIHNFIHSSFNYYTLALQSAFSNYIIIYQYIYQYIYFLRLSAIARCYILCVVYGCEITIHVCDYYDGKYNAIVITVSRGSLTIAQSANYKEGHPWDETHIM